MYDDTDSIGDEYSDFMTVRKSLLSHIELEKAVAEISSEFVRLKPGEVDSAIYRSLERLGDLIGADRLYIFAFEDSDELLTFTHGWYSDRFEYDAEYSQQFKISDYPWWMKKISMLEVMRITDVSKLPYEAIDEISALGQIEIKSLIIVPMVQYGKCIGFLGVDSILETKQWSDDTCNVLKLAGETISNALDRRKMEKELRESRIRFNSLFNSIDEVLMFLDRDYTILMANQACSKKMNTPPEDFRDSKCYRLFYQRKKICEDCPAQEAMQTGNPVVRLRHRSDGTVLRRTVYPALDGSGNISGAVVVASDITESIRLEREMNERREFLEAILDSAPDAIVTLNPEHRIIDWNPGAEKLFGYTADEVSGKDLDDLIARSDHSEEARSLTRVVLGGEYVNPVETVRYRKNGSRINVLVSGSPIILDGNLVAVLGMYTDITEKKRAREEFSRRTRLESLGTLAGGLAHDFNNMLSSIFGNISLAKDILPESNEAYRYIEAVDNAMERATGLTQQLLTFAMGSKPVIEQVDLRKILQESLEFNLAGSSIRQNLDIPADLWMVKVDRRQIAQVFSNLIINSIQAMPAGGDLFIEAENVKHDSNTVSGLEPGSFVRISIRDEGVGIPEEHLQRIFDPYFSTKKDGTGLGLTVIHSIVMKHGGAISVESKNGEGARFTVYLPAEGLPIDQNRLNQVSDTDKIAEDISVLIMDDESMIRKVLGAMLERLGCSVDEAEDGDQAISMYREKWVSDSPYDLIIMDLTIPGGKGGKESVREILEINPEASVIVSSGYSTDPIMADYKSYGFTDVLVKPYKIEDLKRSISRVFESS